MLGPETHQEQLASLHLQTLQYLQAKLGTGCCSSSTKGYEGPREVRGQEGRAWGSTSKFLIVFLEKEISYGHTIPYLTARPLPSLLVAWAKSKTLSTTGPTVHRFLSLMLLGQLPAAHRYCSLASLASPGEHGAASLGKKP